MWILLVVVCVLCLCLIFACICNLKELRCLCGQLEEIARGSHIELTVGSRRRSVLALCRAMNHALAVRDRDHMQYERTEKQLKQNITSLAHDIRTPLTGASGYVQLAKECEDAGKRAHYLQVVEDRLTDLEDMLEEMFLYTKITGEDFQLSVGKVQMLPLLSECLLGMYAKFQERGSEPEVAFESEGFCIRGDEEALRRIFLNLIQNALIHGDGALNIIQSGSLLRFENPISDENCPNTEQMFEKFYKSDSSRRRGSSGLGLFIVKELMRKMGGDVRAQRDGRMLQITLSFEEMTTF